MTDVSLAHGFKVFSEKLEEDYNIPIWKRNGLERLLKDAWDLYETSERRGKERRHDRV